MPKQRDAVRMSPEEVRAFLAEGIKVQVGTVNPDGSPHLSTLFYVLEAGRVAFWTYARSQKVRNLRRDPRITCLVEDGRGYDELRGVTLTGRARLVEDYDEVRALGARVLARMTGQPDLAPEGAGDPAGNAVSEMVARQARKRVGVIVEPARTASWDHAKLGGGGHG